ncbi:tail fiber assembly protein [Shimwellia blattae]|uniref:Tail fiber assembly protein n=2 Tax=Shimwellia blattae TaxID=563 RepID=Q3ZL13_SHIBL|nr:tail fiber assembly protein [Shimwellia blattae]AAX12961.1 tail fiber assembly protein [Shimwellia blattae DSM 4481 = NBRC 105725]AFJ48044.1 putative tail fiber assembly protein [Shimwellia blattae DSM 4481 = NBRC 105725]VDY65543.1 Caudovirales tail fibre assembly protein [Shimwellia blattae]VEC24899.1 Caudovirales tail fibre assembly protein [Shimwellia blattae]GAB81968.1 putative phage tail fiber assembly protein [Shimwellia blattae DSM 4481 = NBRC 105725]
MSFEFSGDPQAIWLYQYDENGVYIGSVFMAIPPNTGLPSRTTHIPCIPPDGQTGIFSNGEWQYIADVRGTPYWDEHGNGFVITSLNESVPDWGITVKPPVADTGFVLLYSGNEWQQIEDKTGQPFYESDGTKHIVSNSWFTLPDNCTFTAPPEVKPTFVTRWTGTEWIYIKDMRGLTVWNTTDKAPLTISELGPVPDGYTQLVPGEFDQWDGNTWVKDISAESEYKQAQAEQHKASLLTEASQQIAVLSYAVDSGQATEEESARLARWQVYRLAVNRTDTTLNDITWPEKP